MRDSRGEGGEEGGGGWRGGGAEEAKEQGKRGREEDSRGGGGKGRRRGRRRRGTIVKRGSSHIQHADDITQRGAQAAQHSDDQTSRIQTGISLCGIWLKGSPRTTHLLDSLVLHPALADVVAEEQPGEGEGGDDHHYHHGDHHQLGDAQVCARHSGRGKGYTRLHSLRSAESFNIPRKFIACN